MTKTNLKEKTLKESFTELEQIAKEFEEGEIDLEQGVDKFKRGLELARDLKKRLSIIENQIQEVKAEFVSDPEPKNEPDTSPEGIPF